MISVVSRHVTLGLRSHDDGARLWSKRRRSGSKNWIGVVNISLGRSVERLRIAWHRRVRPPMRKMYMGTLRRLDLAPPPRPKTSFDGTAGVLGKEGTHPSAQGVTAGASTRPEATTLPEPVPRSKLQVDTENCRFWLQTLSPSDRSDHARTVKRSNLTLLQSELDRWSRLLAPACVENRRM